MSFDLNSYELVKDRKLKLRKDFPDSVIMPIFISDTQQSYNYALIGALIWKDKNVFDELSSDTIESMSKIIQQTNKDNIGISMTSIAILTKADSSGYSLSIAGGKGADRNAWVENAEESAIGRALDNLGYHSGAPSREEMAKVSYMESAQLNRANLESELDFLFQTMRQKMNFTQIKELMHQSVGPFNFYSELSLEQLNHLISLFKQYTIA